MAARRAPTSAPPGLTDADVAELRRRLSAGEAPRVVTRGASATVPAGTRGTVVRIGEATEDEYVVVRIKNDEVPFSPAELALPGAKVAAPAPRRTETPSSRPSGAPATLRGVATTAATPAGSQAAPRPAATPARPAAASRGASRGAAASRGASRRAAASRGASRRAAAPMAVVLRFDGTGWTAEATRGARRLAKPAPLRPGAVGALAEHVDDETLRAALVDTVNACRALVEERAARLRAELHDAEAALRDYDPRPRRSR